MKPQNKKFKTWLKKELYFWLRAKGVNSTANEKLVFIMQQKKYYITHRK